MEMWFFFEGIGTGDCDGVWGETRGCEGEFDGGYPIAGFGGG